MPMTDFRETLYTVDKSGNRRWVYPTLAKGKLFFRRLPTAIILLIVYLSMPWISINGKQAVFFDIPNRQFTLFGTTFWATDSYFLVLILGGLGLSLFLFTALFGRIWCGWACPETVFLEFLFRPLETLIEGNAAARRRLDEMPWNMRKLLKKGTKLLAFAILAWFLASTALAYFVGRERLLSMMSDWPSANMTLFTLTLCLMGFLLFQFGWFREQFCSVLCPYARFQSVLLDPHSLLVGYDRGRGETRAKKKERTESSGDCIDCGLCVRVCPTGIDIRNGLQLECIQCGQCADACDSIMVEIGKKVGLVRYDTEVGLAGGKTKLFRPRVIVYATILVIYVVLFSLILFKRSPFDVQTFHEKGDAPFSILADSKISNHFRMHLSNKSDSANSFRLEISNAQDFQLVTPVNPVPLAAGSHTMVPIFINFNRDRLTRGKVQVRLTVTDQSGRSHTQTVTLLGPDA